MFRARPGGSHLTGGLAMPMRSGRIKGTARTKRARVQDPRAIYAPCKRTGLKAHRIVFDPSESARLDRPRFAGITAQDHGGAR